MNFEDLDRLRKENPFEQVGKLIYECLKQEILEVKLKPNTKLNESKIASELGVSRSPIKHAIDALTADGLLIKERNKISMVAPFSTDDCLKICDARVCVEGEAAFYAARYITKKQLDNLHKLQKRYMESLVSNDPIEAAKVDYQFHTEIVNSSRNKYLIKMYEDIGIYTLRNRCYLQYLIGSEKSRAELQNREKCHDTIIFAIEHGLSDTARKVISLDIQGMLEMYFLR
ncbi:putative L-lactate dehydrogenase operon regulatory protein [Anaerotignum neopropionicum]|uniref:Putative L-lactate dehydrogenase operon regulatory protein n=1 Tax=Anaerotignum neopropionicum TaxID=36847 RepID=A0A136WCI8_9FIRM|nr:GntR family transcriptional regulator [Anaerotignum neopropionicum]KXL52232.1 putative L-lactate dehydrogenase operon regulatory protein [Anaerotignum neopropionicum]